MWRWDMPYALMYEVPGDERMYRAVKGELGDAPIEGLLAHLVVKTDGGLRHLSVWSSPQAWQAFRDERSLPAVHRVLAAAGIPGPTTAPPVEDLELVDCWLPAGGAGS